MRSNGMASGVTLAGACAQATGQPTGNDNTWNMRKFSMGRFIAFLYGLASYAVFFVTLPLRRRLRLGPRGAEDDRHRNGRTEGGSVRRQPPADVRLCHSAQRDGAQAVQAMVDAVRREIGRAQHLCAAHEPRAHSAVLAMAAAARNTKTAIAVISWMRRSSPSLISEQRPSAHVGSVCGQSSRRDLGLVPCRLVVYERHQPDRPFG
jgi:hypothetical protein